MGSPGALSSACPDGGPETRHYYQQLTRMSAAFAFTADLAMGTMGGAPEAQGEAVGPPRRRAVQMYLATAPSSATRTKAARRRPPLLHWALQDCDVQASQQAFEGVIANFPNGCLPPCCAAWWCSRSAAVGAAVGQARPEVAAC